MKHTSKDKVWMKGSVQKGDTLGRWDETSKGFASKGDTLKRSHDTSIVEPVDVLDRHTT